MPWMMGGGDFRWILQPSEWPLSCGQFHWKNIFFVKEQGDASDTKQPYSESVTKCNKQAVTFTWLYQNNAGDVTQWDLIDTYIIA